MPNVCIAILTPAPKRNVSKTFQPREALSVIDQLAGAGLLVLAFSGGEPMLRRDWRELVRHAVARGLSVNVGTNGSTITERSAVDLKRLGVKSVTVSLDSHLPEVDIIQQPNGIQKLSLSGRGVGPEKAQIVMESPFEQRRLPPARK